MNNNHLQGKTAIITGAGYATLSDGRCGSIGYGIATAFAKEGANLVITGRQVPKLEKAKAELERLYGVKVLAIPADISAGADNAATAKAVVDAAHPRALVKVIIETCVLTDEEKVKVCQLAKEAGADFVKTSTGFGDGGATAADVRLMKETVGEGVQVKASTGINNRQTCDEMIAAGAVRMGTSKGVFIVKDELP